MRDAVIVIDESVRDTPNLVAGANRVGWHMLNTNPGRDYAPDVVADIAAAEAGFPCPTCGAPLTAERAIEVGNIFKLGTRYSKALGADYLDAEGISHPIFMGSYGIGSGRVAATVVEQHHDERGSSGRSRSRRSTCRCSGSAARTTPSRARRPTGSTTS